MDITRTISNTSTTVASMNYIDTNIYIKIPSHILTFKMLTSEYQLFEVIQKQYLCYLDELVEIFRPFANECGHHDLDARMTYTKNQLINFNNDISSYRDIELLFSYNTVRQQILNIITFFKTSDDSDKKMLIYLQLYDGLGVCLPGFNRKATDTAEYISMDLTNIQDINSKLYTKLNIVLKEIANKVFLLLKSEDKLPEVFVANEVHYLNTILLEVYEKYNLNKNVDPKFELYDAYVGDFSSLKDDINHKLDYQLPRSKICYLLAEIFYQEFTDIISNQIKKPEWLTDDINPSEFIYGIIREIDILFILQVNKYFNIQDDHDSEKFSMGYITEQENGYYSFANMQDILHKYIATNIEKLPHNILNKTFADNFKVEVDGGNYISSINSGYFYLATKDETQYPITIKDLNLQVKTPSFHDENVFSRLTDELKVPAIVQALVNKNSSIEDIYMFFNNQHNINCIFSNEYIAKTLIDAILASAELTQKTQEVIDFPYTKYPLNASSFRCEWFFTKSGFISPDALTNSLIRRNVVIIKDVILGMSEKNLYAFLSVLSVGNLTKLLNLITPEDDFIIKFNSVFIDCVRQGNFKLLNILSDSDILVQNFLKSKEFQEDSKGVIRNLAENNQGKLLGKIIVAYPHLHDNDLQKNSLHYAVYCKDKQVLENIISKLTTEEIQEYLLSKDMNDKTPIAYATELNNNIFIEVLEPHITNNVLMAKTTYYIEQNYNNIMCVIASGFNIAAELLNKLTISDIKNSVSDSGVTLLMLACIHHEQKVIIDKLLSIISLNDDYITRINCLQQNALSFAIRFNNYYAFEKIISICKDQKLFAIPILEGSTYTPLYDALLIKDTNLRRQCFDLLLEYYKDNLPTSNNVRFYMSLLHVVIYYEDLDILAKILPCCTKKLLTTKTELEIYTPINLALNFFKDCIPILLPYYQTIDMLKSAQLHENDDLVLLIKEGIPLDDYLLELFDDKLLQESTNKGYNLLMLAIEYQNIDWVKKLLPKYKSDILLKCNNNGENILFMAAFSHNLDMVKHILQGIDLNTLEKLYTQEYGDEDSLKTIINGNSPYSIISEEITSILLDKLNHVN